MALVFTCSVEKFVTAGCLLSVIVRANNFESRPDFQSRAAAATVDNPFSSNVILGHYKVEGSIASREIIQDESREVL